MLISHHYSIQSHGRDDVLHMLVLNNVISVSAITVYDQEDAQGTGMKSTRGDIVIETFSNANCLTKHFTLAIGAT